jgi:hypothetical protein
MGQLPADERVCGRIFVAESDTPCRSTGEPIDDVSIRQRVGFDCLRLALEYGDPLQSLLPQRCGVTRNGELAGSFDVWHSAVKRQDKFMQMTQLVRHINVSGLLHRFLWSSSIAIQC